ncbi:helix-turn-helix domain-containing protein [Kitasatospora kifunensis]|uniref:Transposase-like protein n=1 Tax=Kitasatospora kifunensis TaxID=58351 RepID=A0A7W7VTU3_KITKI|nr:helix-turn-helix domain-containing protein [Kitasatospora kifunensis]MBB4922138.1 transposase-like protein [Kitasatospora kifunensis]
MPVPVTAPPPPGCLWIEQAAERLGIKPGTLHKWRQKRRGPASFKHAGRVTYREIALERYLAECEAADSHSNPALNPLLRAPEPHIRRSRAA